jgi:N-carbamoylputrescine amidase
LISITSVFIVRAVMAEPRRVRVAAIQVSSIDGEPERNLANAERYVAEAARSGAELVLCPEFLAPGYKFEESIWTWAEPCDGRTERWLSSVGRAHRIIVGATYLEAAGDDFYNTFSLFGSSGQLLGRVRKRSLPFFEGWLFCPCTKPKVIDTPIGKLGVGICNDAQTADLLRSLTVEQPDLVVMPHSAPAPQGVAFGPIRAVIARQLATTPRRWANALGVPVVLANKVSAETVRTRIPMLPWIHVGLRFRGGSSICDSDGTMLERMIDREGVVFADVHLDPARKRVPVAPDRGYWSFPPSMFARTGGALLRVFEALGRRAYRKNQRRIAAAREIARSGGPSAPRDAFRVSP